MSLLLALTGGGGPTAYTLEGEAGSYTLSGQDATFTVSFALAGDAGSYTIAGQDAEFVVVTAAPEVVSLGGKGHPARLQDLPTWAVEVRARLVDENDRVQARAQITPLFDQPDTLLASAQILPLVSVARAELLDESDAVAGAAKMLARIELDMDAEGFVQAIKAITRAQMDPTPLRRDGPKLIRGRA